MELQSGIKNEKSIVVTEELTASKVGSGLLPVYATPSMIALMENTCADCVQPYMQEGDGTVGTSVDIKHVSATPVGKTVRCECTLTEVNGKKLVFEVNAYDDKGLIGTGTHKRAIINNEAFMARLA
ncbi:MAG: thioesterase family protein [Eubacteriales bacterium]|nr:thioesterase family protein [Eubacteriales bacterium]